MPGLWPGKKSLFLSELGARVIKDDCAGLAAEMTYNWMLSLLPMLIFIFTLFGLLNAQPTLFAQVIRVLRRLIPGEAFLLVQASLNQLIQDSNGGLAVISLLATLWTASNGAITVEKAFMRFYAMDDKPLVFWKQRLIAILVIMGIVILLLICTNLMVFGEVILSILKHGLGLPETAIELFTLWRWLIPIVSLFLLSWFVYASVPRNFEEHPWPKRWPGALVFVPLWIVFSLLFSTYVNNMGNYSKIYGPMGAIVILMIWLYFSSFALLVGCEVNALLLHFKQSRYKKSD